MVEIIVDIVVLWSFIWLSNRDAVKYAGKPLEYKTFVLAGIDIAFILYSQYQLITDLGKLL
jgi:hypothetical protein